MTGSYQIDWHQKSYVCIHVFEDTRPVLLVARNGGNWSFLCGYGHDDLVAEGRVVGIGHILDRDPTLLSLLDLPPEWEAERKSVEDAWVRVRCDEAAP